MTAPLLGAARVQTARAALRDWQDPQATLRAWAAAGPWQAQAAGGDPALLGLPTEPTVEESRQWVDRAGDRAREERAGGLVLVRAGERWWRAHPGIGSASGDGGVEVAVALSRWTDPAPLAALLDLQAAGEATVAGRPARRLTAHARDDAYALELAPLGWGAARWELAVDAATGMLLETVAFAPDDAPFRRVEAIELALDEPLDDGLFAPL